jgi:cytochrome c553
MNSETLRKSWTYVAWMGLFLGACDPATTDSTPPGRATPVIPIREPDVAGTGSIAPIGFAGAPPCMSKGGCMFGGSVPFVLDRPVQQADTSPPPISGGTLLATRDGKLLVAADSDRDQLYFVDNAARSLMHVRQLQPGDEPGRVVEDAAGRIHVALRGGRAVATLGRAADSAITRRSVCDLPRGLAYDAAHDVLQVACAEGKLVTLPAAPDAAALRVVEIGRDARDVLVRGDQLFVTHFRAAELLGLDASGAMQKRYTPPTFTQSEPQLVPFTGDPSNSGAPATVQVLNVDSTPTSAWRVIDVPGRGIAMLHQRARSAEVQVQAGGYGAGSCGSGIVQTSISTGLDTGRVISTDLIDATLAVDMASDPDGVLLAVVAPGNWGGGSQLQLYSLANNSVFSQSSSGNFGVAGQAAGEADAGVGSVQSCIGSDRMLEQPAGQATAVVFASAYELAVQEREPAAISFIDTRTGAISVHVDLKQPSRFDTGHSIFHLRAGAGVACASCHAEAGDDGHVWTFHGIGARRTQTLRGGILGTEPFHWNGDMKDFSTLVTEVFVGRMAGFSPSDEQTSALSHWIDRQPALAAQARDPNAAQRGKELFESDAVGCKGCHSGAHLTNNTFADVGTGARLQVPSLHGVSFRTPLMHNGCAAQLADRFNPSCGGGDQHGHTSQLSAAQLGDLTSYLETL